MKNQKPWNLKSITRKDEGLHEIVFNVDGKPSVVMTIKGSFSLDGRDGECGTLSTPNSELENYPDPVQFIAEKNGGKGELILTVATSDLSPCPLSPLQ
ncbi:hypothetical protein ACI0FM_08695 [Paenochrobactrum sp. BZR 588]|uniref:hypothetical protein n=1 Tax=unclassified Paenochrobactrum TaxID=2639760 RepID=UPI003854787C